MADGATDEKISRRVWLRRATALGVLVVVGGGVAGVRTSGYALPAGRAVRNLRAWHYAVLAAAAARICAPDRPSLVAAGASGVSGAKAPSIDDVDLMGWVDRYIGKMDPAVRRDLLRLVGYLEHGEPLRLGLLSRFTSLGSTDQDRVLSSLEASDVGLLRGGFSGLKALIFMGYYRHPATWSILGYGGPMLGPVPGQLSE